MRRRNRRRIETEFMSTFNITKATRQGVKPLIVLYSESGCGKTMSALLMARGIAGPSGRIILADSESGRGSLYADVIPGGYETFELCAPFSPQRYIEAIDAMEEAGAAVGILDSGSHEWEGPGGVLDQATENEERTKKSGLHNWRLPKLEHAKFVQRLLRSKMPIIVCLRAKHKSRQVKGTKEMADNGEINFNQVGKSIILKDNYTSPIQAEDFIFEATAHAEVMPDHSIHLTKCSHPDLGKCFPKDFTTPVTITTGEAVERWAQGGANGSSSTLAAEPDDLLLEIKEAEDGFQLTGLVDQANLIEDATRQKFIKQAIMNRAKELRFIWNDQAKAFITLG